MTKLICFGASTAEGVGDSQGGFFKRLERKLAADGRAHLCLNFGIGGNTTADMAPRLGSLKPHLPAPAILLLGSNDFPREGDPEPWRRVELADFRANLEKIFAAFAAGPTIFVTSFQVRWVTPEIFRAYTEVALELARARAFTIWDLHAESLAFGEKYLCEDGIHYNDAGHELIAKRLQKLLPA
jgi:lysophospholipase L1-like esterase